MSSCLDLITGNVYWQSAVVINSKTEISNSQVHARYLRHEAETQTRA